MIIYGNKFANKIEKLKGLIKIGMWASNCCDRDLFEIKTQEQIDDIIEWIISDIDDGISTYTIFSTKKEALNYFRKCGLDC